MKATKLILGLAAFGLLSLMVTTGYAQQLRYAQDERLLTTTDSTYTQEVAKAPTRETGRLAEPHLITIDGRNVLAIRKADGSYVIYETTGTVKSDSGEIILSGGSLWIADTVAGTLTEAEMEAIDTGSGEESTSIVSPIW